MAAGIVAVLFTQVFGIARIVGSSMKPTSGDGDLALTYRIADALEADDIVVYQRGGEELVGRVVALPGDEVEVTQEGELRVNGSAQSSASGAACDPGDAVEYPLRLGAGEYFVLPDARGDALGSCELGAIGINEVKGKVIALLRLRQI